MIFVIGMVMIITTGVLGVILSVKKAQRRKVKMNNKEERKKARFGSTYKPPVYKPKLLKQEDLEGAMKESLAPREERTLEPQRAGLYPTLHREVQKPLFQTKLPEPKPEPEVKPEEEEEPYWEAEEWEDWGYQIYLNYPEVRQFLPDWFVKALEEELSKQT